MSDNDDVADVVQDYPAAHSMDTTWWAVDQHGHVAKFETGEAGSAPATMEEPQDESELIDELARSGATFYCDDLFEKPDGKLYHRSWNQRWTDVAKQLAEPPAEQRYFHGYLLWLRDEAAIDELQPPKPAQSLLTQVTRLFAAAAAPALQTRKVLRLPVPGKVIVALSGVTNTDPPPPAFVRDLLARGIALRAWMYDREPEVERFGIFAYDMDQFDNWIAGPFEKTGDPSRPLRVEELPESFRAVAEACRLERVDFQRDVLVQPFEHGEAHCWGEDWVSTTGQRRPTTEFGHETTAIPQAAVEQLAKTKVRGGSTLLALLAAYLKVEPGSAEVLGDYLEEAGQSPIAGGPTAVERLDEVLLRFFSPAERQALEADFVEHLLPESTESPEHIQVARAAIDAVRQQLAGTATAEQLQAASNEAFGAWAPDGEEEPERSRLAWAAWALAKQMPLVAARTARALGIGELSWQVQRTLDALAQKPT